MVAWCPLWTPSKTPMVTAERPHPAGAASIPRQRCISAPLLDRTDWADGWCQHDLGPGPTVPIGHDGDDLPIRIENSHRARVAGRWDRPTPGQDRGKVRVHIAAR